MISSAKDSPELSEIVDLRISSLIHELEDADWSTEDVVLTIDAVIQDRWLNKLDALREARLATPANFVSDGNEG